MNFEVAQVRAKETAEDFLGDESRIVVTTELGGTAEDDRVCEKLVLLMNKDEDPRVETLEFADENGEGAIELRLYDVDGIKFVEEQVDEGDQPKAGETFYVALEVYDQLL